jgi:hypothetical protein
MLIHPLGGLFNRLTKKAVKTGVDHSLNLVDPNELLAGG